MFKKRIFCTLLILSSCATPRNLVPADISSTLPYDEAYNRISKAAKICFSTQIVDSDLYEAKKLGEVSIGTQPRGFSYWNGFTVVSEPGYPKNLLTIAVTPTASMKGSQIKLNDNIFAPIIDKWLKAEIVCPTKQ